MCNNLHKINVSETNKLIRTQQQLINIIISCFVEMQIAQNKYSQLLTQKKTEDAKISISSYTLPTNYIIEETKFVSETVIKPVLDIETVLRRHDLTISVSSGFKAYCSRRFNNSRKIA